MVQPSIPGRALRWVFSMYFIISVFIQGKVTASPSDSPKPAKPSWAPTVSSRPTTFPNPAPSQFLRPSKSPSVDDTNPPPDRPGKPTAAPVVEQDSSPSIMPSKPMKPTAYPSDIDMNSTYPTLSPSKPVKPTLSPSHIDANTTTPTGPSKPVKTVKPTSYPTITDFTSKNLTNSPSKPIKPTNAPTLNDFNASSPTVAPSRVPKPTRPPKANGIFDAFTHKVSDSHGNGPNRGNDDNTSPNTRPSRPPSSNNGPTKPSPAPVSYTGSSKPTSSYSSSNRPTNYPSQSFIKPTFVPVNTMSANPTTIGTKPTKPSYAPSYIFIPSQIPTLNKPSLPTIMPSPDRPKPLRPSKSPSSASVMPTKEDSSSPTSSPIEGTDIILIMKIRQFISTYLTSLDYLNDKDAESAFASIVSSIVPSDGLQEIEVVSVVDSISASGSKSIDLRRLSSTGVTVSYKISYLVTSASMISALEMQVTESITTSVASGQFISLLQSSDSSFFATSTDAATPTVSSTESTSSNSHSNENMTRGIIIGVCIAVAILVIGLSLYCFSRRKQAVATTGIEVVRSNGNSPTTNASAPPMPHETSNTLHATNIVHAVEVVNSTGCARVFNPNVPVFDSNGVSVVVVTERHAKEEVGCRSANAVVI